MFKKQIKVQDMLWLRSVRSAKELTKRGKPWRLAYHRITEATPWDNATAIELLGMDGVFTTVVTLRALVIHIVGRGWDFVRADCNDLEDVYQNLLDCMTAEPEAVHAVAGSPGWAAR